MGGIKVYISDELEKKFRETAMRLYGYNKGSLSIAAEKALRAWISQAQVSMEVIGTIDDPVKAIEGMLAHVKKSGVELQHEASKIRAKKTLR